MAGINRNGICTYSMLEDKNVATILKNDIAIGANLLKNSIDKNQSTTAYMVKSYNLSEMLTVNQQYTYQIKANLSDEKKMIGIWVGGGSYCAGTSQKNKSGMYSVTFTASSNMADKTYVNVYCSNNTGVQGSTAVTGTCEIEWIKLEKGSMATPWVPNINDDIYSSLDIATMSKTIVSPIKATDFYEY